MAEQNNSYPMISEKNWWTIREKFKASIPSTVTPNYVKTLLTMGSDNSANSNVISPMKRLGLLDDEGKPTLAANNWRLDDKYKATCDEIIQKVYPTELLDLFPTRDIDRNSARTWFMSQGVGQGAADKMVALFSLLKSGDIKDLKSTASKQNKTNSKKSSSKIIDKSAKASGTIEISSNGLEHTSNQQNRPNLHIDLQIHISPESTPEQIESIFASMAKHLYGADK